MADAPKGEKGGKSEGPKKNLLEELILLTFILFILGAMFARLTALFDSQSYSGPLEAWRNFFLNNIAPILHIIALVLSMAFIFGIWWSITKLTAINKELNAFFGAHAVSGALPNVGTEEKTNHKWERVLSHLNSQSQNDWKFAILEADIMLGDLLETLEYQGPTMADKLKAVDPADFKSIEAAWEAHKIRNTIAHEGADYVLSDREARRVIDLYASVFKEFKII
jgi:hypothetical protein